MTLQMLQYFAAVAQRRNFTKAAQDCHVTQPALSRAIQTLEEEMECPLLMRSGRTVVLTEAGEVCLTEAKKALQQCEALKLRVQEAGRKSRRPLRVGYVMIDYLKDFMQRLFGGTDAVPPFQIETVYDTVENIRQDLESGKLDMLILPEVCMSGLEDIEYGYLLRGPLHAIVYKSNPFSERTELRLEELKDQPLVVFKETLFKTSAIQAFLAAGVAPRVVAEGEKQGDVLAQIRVHNAIGVGSALFGTLNINDYREIPIVDSPRHFGSVCVWKKDDPSQALRELKKLLEKSGNQ